MLEHDRPVERQRFQRTPVTRAFLLCGAALIIGVMGWLYAEIVARPDTTSRQALAVGGYLASFIGLALWGIALTARALVVDSEGVTVNGLFRSRRWAWADVEVIDAAADTSVTISPFLVLKNGRRVWLRCANGYAVTRVPPHVQVAVTSMQQQLDAYRSTGARTTGTPNTK